MSMTVACCTIGGADYNTRDKPCLKMTQRLLGLVCKMRMACRPGACLPSAARPSRIPAGCGGLLQQPVRVAALLEAAS